MIHCEHERLKELCRELLAACEMVLTRLDLEAEEHEVFVCGALRPVLRAAIAKARGES